MKMTVSATMPFIDSLSSTKMIFMCIFLGTITETIVSAAYEFRLFKTSDQYTEGLVEVNTNGQWSLVSEAYFTFSDETSVVLCQTLGLGSVGFSTLMNYHSYLNYTGFLAYEVFECNVWTEDATECFDNIWYEMSLSDGTPVTRLHCYDSRINNIRLEGGLVPHEGRLEVRIGEKWGTVCDDSVDGYFESEDEVCKLLGYAGSGIYYASQSSSEDMEAWLEELYCETDVTDINNCSYVLGDVPGGCSGYYNGELDVYCSPLRLVDGPSENSGRLEAVFDGKLQTICADDFSIAAATVSCELLGYSDVVDLFTVPEPSIGSIQMLQSSVKCNGNETSLEYCDISISTGFTCNSGSVVGVTCLVLLGAYCDLTETCSEVMHSICEDYECTCKGGYASSGDRNCTECSAEKYGRNCTSDCDCNISRSRESLDGRQCDKVTGQCECKAAWSGLTCDDDVDECLNLTICQDQNTQCKNTIGGYECICVQGHERQGLSGCVSVDGSNDGMMLVIILASVVGGLTLITILFFICFCRYKRQIRGSTYTSDKPVRENRFRNNILATSIRSTKEGEVYDTIRDESDAFHANALRATKNKDDGYLTFEPVNRNKLSQTGGKLYDEGYIDVGGVRLPEIPKNFSTTGTEGSKDPYSELKQKKMPEYMHERMADEDGYMKPVGRGNVKPVEI